MQKDIEKFEKAGIQLVGISYDKISVLKAFSEKSGVKFPLLSDEGSQIIKKLDLEFKDGLPHPGTLLIDRKKTVRAKIFNDGYRERHESDELLSVAKEVGLIKMKSPDK